MGSRCAVLIPSLRPDRWPDIRGQVKAAGASAYFLGDRYRSYSEAINIGWRRTSEPYLFLGADDLVFHDGWLDEALKLMAGDVRVVGTNDLHNKYVRRGLHATHYLIDRRYIEGIGGVIDRGPGTILYPYRASFTDAEFIETARHRGVFASARFSRVEHLHPDFGTRKPDEVDARTSRNLSRDYSTFMSRRYLWPFEGQHELEYLPPERK